MPEVNGISYMIVEDEKSTLVRRSITETNNNVSCYRL